VKILVLAEFFPVTYDPTSGIFILEQLRALRKMGVNAVVLRPIPWPPRFLRWMPRVRKYFEMPLQAEIDGFEVHYPRIPAFPGGRLYSLYGLLQYLWSRRLVRQCMTEEKIDLIHAHTVTPSGFAAVLLGREFKLPVVCTARGSDILVTPQRSRATLLATTWSLRRVGRLAAVSQDLKCKIENLIGARAVEVVQNGVDAAMFKPMAKTQARARLMLPVDREIILYVGHLSPCKGLEFLLDAVTRLGTPDALLYLVGDGVLKKELVAMASRLGITERCVFVGTRPHEEIPLWLGAADCLVLPSLSEGIPNVLREAMICRVPIIATPVGGIPEIIKHRQTGILVPVRDSTALAQAIQDVLNPSSDFLSEMVNRADNAAKNMAWESNARQMIAVYQDALAESMAQDTGTPCEVSTHDLGPSC
jgi:glycosyltransferase involved in cell wall biosynthesis